MRRGLFAAVLSGALIGFCGVAFADTTDDSGNGGGDAPNRQNFRDGGNRGGQRGNWGGGGQRGGQRGNWGGGRGGFRGGPGGGFGGMMYNRTLREGEIQAKFPKEYEAAAKQLIEAEAKLRELARKAKVELPADMNSTYRELRLKDPAGFAEVEKLLKSQDRDERRKGMEKMRALAEKNGIKLPGPAMGGGMGFRRPGGEGRDGGNRGGDGPRMRDNNPRQIRLVREKFPEEFKKVNELRQAGKKQEADELLRDLMRRVAPRPPRD